MKKEHKKNKNTIKKINNQKLLISLLIAIICIVIAAMLFDPWSKCDNLRIILVALLSTIGSIFGVACIWEIFGKRSFANEILEITDLSSDMKELGIIKITNDFDKINLHDYLKETKMAKIAVLLGANVFTDKNNRKFFPDLSQLTVVISNKKDQSFIEFLVKRFSAFNSESTYDKEKIISRIKSSKDELNNLKEQGVNVKIIESNIDLHSSYYLFDKYAIMANFGHQKNYKGVPAIVCKKGGILYEYIKEEVDSLIKCAEANKELQYEK